MAICTQLSFTCDGYGAATLEVQVPTNGGATVEDEVVLAGLPGSINGQVLLPEGFAAALLRGITVELRRIDADEGSDPEHRTPLSEDGFYIVRGIEPGDWHLDVRSEGFLPERERVEVRRGSETGVGRIQLRVLDPAAVDGAPFITGRARLQGLADDTSHRGILVEALDTPFAAATTADGRFRLAVNPGPHRLRFTREGYGTATAEQHAPEAGGAVLPSDVVLAGLPGRIEGRLVLPAGFGIAALRDVTLERHAPNARADALPVDRADAGDDGFFVFPVVNPGEWRLRVHSEAFLPAETVVRVAPGTAATAGRIQLGARLADDAGRAIAIEGRARLQGVAGDVSHGGILVEAVDTPFAARTTSAGRFLLGVTAGTHRLRFSFEGYGTVIAEVEVRREGGIVIEDDVVLPANPGSLRALVSMERFADATRLQSADVSLRAPGDLPERAILSANPAGDGQLFVDGVPPGRFVVHVTAPGYRSLARDVSISPGEAIDLGELILRHDSDGPDAVTLSGVVRLADAADHSGTRVRVWLAGWPIPYREVLTQADGRFELAASAAESYRLDLDRPGYGPAELGPVVWDSEREGFSLDDGRPVEDTLRRAALAGRVEVSVIFSPAWLPADQLRARIRITDPDGSRTIEGIAAGQPVSVDVPQIGRYRISAERDGFEALPQWAEVSAENAHVVLPQFEIQLVDLARARLALAGETIDAAELPPGVSLAGANLSSATLVGDFSGRELTGANLTNADLGRAGLQDANLSQAVLVGANLRGADLSGAILVLASLFAADLQGATLVGADLRFANLSSANLEGAVLTGDGEPRAQPPCDRSPGARRPAIRLQGVLLARANLTGAQLAGVDLESVDLSGTQLARANLTGACLRGSALNRANAASASFRGADLRDARMVGSLLTSSDLRGADLTDASLVSAVLDRTRMDCVDTDPSTGRCQCALPLDAYEPAAACAVPAVAQGWSPECACRNRAGGVNWTAATFFGARLDGAYLADARFAGASLSESLDPPIYPPFDCTLPAGCASWANRGQCGELARACMGGPTSLTGARLDRADLSGLTVTRVDLLGARARNARMSNSRFLRSRLIEIDFSGVEAEQVDFSGSHDLTDGRFTDATLRGARFRGVTLRRVGWSGADLTRVDLNGMDLRGLDFSRATLVEVDLGESDLTGANLSAADLTGANLGDTRLQGVDLSGARVRGHDFSGVDLSGARFNGTDLRAMAFVSATLAGAEFIGAILRDADLSGADLTAADLGGADLQDSILDDAELDNAWLSQATLTRSSLSGASLTEADLTDADLTDADFSGADLESATLRNARVVRATFAAANLDGADLVGLDLSGNDLSGARFVGANLGETNLAAQRLDGADLNHAILRSADLRAVDFRGADLSDVDLRGARADGLDLRWADISRAQLGGADLTGADLRAVMNREPFLHDEATNFHETRLCREVSLAGPHLGEPS